MTQQKKCQGCGKKLHCDQAYKIVGNSKTPPVTKTILMAFVIPLLFFIITLAVTTELLNPLFGSETVASALAFAIALIATMLLIMIIRLFTVKGNKKVYYDNCDKEKNDVSRGNSSS